MKTNANKNVIKYSSMYKIEKYDIFYKDLYIVNFLLHKPLLNMLPHWSISLWGWNKNAHHFCRGHFKIPFPVHIDAFWLCFHWHFVPTSPNQNKPALVHIIIWTWSQLSNKPLVVPTINNQHHPHPKCCNANWTSSSSLTKTSEGVDGLIIWPSN